MAESATIWPVGKKSTDEILGVIGYVTVVGEGQGVLMVHNFAVGPHKGVCIERSVA